MKNKPTAKQIERTAARIYNFVANACNHTGSHTLNRAADRDTARWDAVALFHLTEHRTEKQMNQLETDFKEMCRDNFRLAEENAKLRGIIARATAERLDGREGCHITREDVEASLEILYAEQKGRKTK